MNFKYITYTDIGLKRTDNEDAFGVFEIENGVLAVVCDGLGGNKAGDVASYMAVKEISETFKSLNEVDYLERIKLSIQSANRIILKESSSVSEHRGMATTVEVLYLKNDTSYWGHIGDSRIYNFKNGKIKQLTKDHSLVQKLVDDGFLTMKEAENHPQKNIILRALGDSNAIEVDLSKMKFHVDENHSFMLCSDGVTGVIKDEELEHIFRFNQLEKISDKLSSLIIERGAPDNFTFVIITIS